MNFESYLDQAWTDHATQSAQVAAGMKDAISLMQTADDLVAFSHLATHVFGEHLARFEDGLVLLKSLQNLEIAKSSEAQNQLKRCFAVLELEIGQRFSVEEFSISDQVRILSQAASALMSLNREAESNSFFEKAMVKIETLSRQPDPAHRGLAIAANNIAAAFEEKPERSEQQTERMVRAARTARHYWELAGGWQQIALAEIRLSHSSRKAGLLTLALESAENGLQIYQENKASDFDFFFAFEALALANKSLSNLNSFRAILEKMQTAFEKLSQAEKQICVSVLEKLQETARNTVD